MVARVFPILGVRNLESPGSEEYKARAVLAGDRVSTKSGSPAHALYTETSAAPAAMSSARAAIATAAVRSWQVTVRDAESAFLQASINKPGRPTMWVRLPRMWWPAEWFDAQTGAPRFRDPVVQLERALYGHPEASALWEEHF